MLAFLAATSNARYISILGMFDTELLLNSYATYCLCSSSHKPSDASITDLYEFFIGNTFISGYHVM